MALGCESCKYGTYTLARGKIEFKTLQSQPLIENRKCLRCKKGSTCDIDVKAKPNHWGYKTKTSQLVFLTCPEKYCCQNSTECDSFDSCSPRRRGTLCGECRKGFKLSLLTPDCIPNDELCDFLWFVYYVLMSGGVSTGALSICGTNGSIGCILCALATATIKTNNTPVINVFIILASLSLNLNSYPIQ